MWHAQNMENSVRLAQCLGPCQKLFTEQKYMCLTDRHTQTNKHTPHTYRHNTNRTKSNTRTPTHTHTHLEFVPVYSINKQQLDKSGTGTQTQCEKHMTNVRWQLPCWKMSQLHIQAGPSLSSSLSVWHESCFFFTFVPGVLSRLQKVFLPFKSCQFI